MGNAHLCFQIVGLDEMSPSTVKESVFKAHAAIVLRHIMMLSKLFPPAVARAVPVVVAMEQNTYHADNLHVTRIISEYAARKGVNVTIYRENETVGFQTTRATKLTATLSAVSAINNATMSYTADVFSGGRSLLKAIKESDEAIDDCLGRDVVGDRESALNPDAYLPQPKSKEEMDLMSNVQKLVYIQDFKNLANLALTPPTEECFIAGQEELRNLCNQLRLVEIDITTKEPQVLTGGKKKTKGAYSKDDLYCAFFIATELATRNRYGR